MRLVLSSATVPAGLTHGAAQVTVNVAVPVIGEMASLKAAVITLLLKGTRVALFRGATAVPVGGAALLSKPSTVSRPPLPPPQAASAPTRRAASHGLMFMDRFISFPR